MEKNSIKIKPKNEQLYCKKVTFEDMRYVFSNTQPTSRQWQLREFKAFEKLNRNVTCLDF